MKVSSPHRGNSVNAEMKEGEHLAKAEYKSTAEVYEAHQAFVWSSLRKLGVSADMVDDAVQEVFLVVHRRLDEFEHRSSIRTWLFRISMNVAKNFVRRRIRAQKRKQEQNVENVGPDGTTLGLNPQREDHKRWMDWQELDRLMLELPMDYRAVLVLTQLEGCSAPEAAERLGVPLNTVYSRLRRGRKQLLSVARKKGIRPQ